MPSAELVRTVISHVTHNSAHEGVGGGKRGLIGMRVKKPKTHGLKYQLKHVELLSKHTVAATMMKSQKKKGRKPKATSTDQCQISTSTVAGRSELFMVGDVKYVK
jgi:hypothetical protein